MSWILAIVESPRVSQTSSGVCAGGGGGGTALESWRVTSVQFLATSFTFAITGRVVAGADAAQIPAPGGASGTVAPSRVADCAGIDCHDAARTTASAASFSFVGDEYLNQPIRARLMSWFILNPVTWDVPWKSVERAMILS